MKCLSQSWEQSMSILCQDKTRWKPLFPWTVLSHSEGHMYARGKERQELFEIQDKAMVMALCLSSL